MEPELGAWLGAWLGSCGLWEPGWEPGWELVTATTSSPTLQARLADWLLAYAPPFLKKRKERGEVKYCSGRLHPACQSQPHALHTARLPHRQRSAICGVIARVALTRQPSPAIQQAARRAMLTEIAKLHYAKTEGKKTCRLGFVSADLHVSRL